MYHLFVYDIIFNMILIYFLYHPTRAYAKFPRTYGFSASLVRVRILIMPANLKSKTLPPGVIRKHVVSALMGLGFIFGPDHSGGLALDRGVGNRRTRRQAAGAQRDAAKEKSDSSEAEQTTRSPSSSASARSPSAGSEADSYISQISARGQAQATVQSSAGTAARRGAYRARVDELAREAIAQIRGDEPGETDDEEEVRSAAAAYAAAREATAGESGEESPENDASSGESSGESSGGNKSGTSSSDSSSGSSGDEAVAKYQPASSSSSSEDSDDGYESPGSPAPSPDKCMNGPKPSPPEYPPPPKSYWSKGLPCPEKVIKFAKLYSFFGLPEEEGEVTLDDLCSDEEHIDEYIARHEKPHALYGYETHAAYMDDNADLRLPPTPRATDEPMPQAHRGNDDRCDCPSCCAAFAEERAAEADTKMMPPPSADAPQLPEMDGNGHPMAMAMADGWQWLKWGGLKWTGTIYKFGTWWCPKPPPGPPAGTSTWGPKPPSHPPLRQTRTHFKCTADGYGQTWAQEIDWEGWAQKGWKSEPNDRRRMGKGRGGRGPGSGRGRDRARRADVNRIPIQPLRPPATDSTNRLISRKHVVFARKAGINTTFL